MRKAVFALALLLAIIVAGLWRYAPELVAYAIRAEAARLDVDIRRLEVRRVSRNRLQIAHLDLFTRSQFGEYAMQVTDLKAEFDLWSRTLLGITAGHVSVSGSAHPPPRRDDRGTLVLPPIPPLDVGRLQVDLNSPAGPLAFDGAVSARSSAQAAEIRVSDALGSLHLRYDPEASLLRGTASLAGSDDAFVGVEVALDGDAPVRFELDADLAPTLSWAQANPWLPSAYRKGIAAWRLGRGELRASGELGADRGWVVDTRLAWRNLQHQQYRASGELSGGLTQNGAGWQWRAKTPGHLRVILTDAEQIRPSELIAVELSVEPGYAVAANLPADAGIGLAGSGPGSLSAIRQDGMVLIGHAPDWRLDDNALSGSLALDGLRLRSTDVVAARLDTTLRRLDASFQNWSGEFSVADLRLANWPQAQPGIGVQGRWQSTAENISAAGSLDVPRPGMTRWKLDVRDPVGSLHVNLDAPAPLLLDWGRSLTGMQRGLLMLDSGTVKASIDADWRDQIIHASAKIRGAEIGGKLMESTFSGMSVEAASEDLVRPAFEFRVHAQEGRLPVDAAWTDLRLAGRWSSNATDVREASLRTLGGEVSLAPFSLSADPAGAQRLVVNLAGVDLSTLLVLMGLEALTAEGRLDGSLPIVLSPDGPSVDHGVLISAGPGVIRYRPPGGDAVAGMDNLAMRALRDFRYDTLNATLSYATNGDYRIRLRLVGNNPQVLGGRLLALNPDITGNLPELLQAVLLTGDFGTAVLRQIQREQGAQGAH